jgi:hypothetical protein
MLKEINKDALQSKSMYISNLILLISTLLLLAMQPYILSIGNSFWVLGILTILLLAGVWINKWSKKKVVLKLLLVLLNAVCACLYFYFETTDLKVIYILSILFLMISTLLVQFLTVLKTKRADSSIIFSSINFYLIAGYTGACFAWLLETLSPGSFVINHPVHSHLLFDFVNFSFVTMATLGYGDIIPSNEFGKTLAVFISLFGQLYITIFLSIIISKFIKQQED